MHLPTRSAVYLFLVLASILLSREGFAQPPSEEHYLLLIDKSGSMQTPRSDGSTRFQEAIRRAKIQPSLPSNPSIPRYFAVWTFESGAAGGASHIQVQDFADASTTLNTLSSLTVGTGATPLAGSLCDAAKHLREFRSDQKNTIKFLRLVSDGEENDTPSSSPCWGPSSVGVYPKLDTNSWQWKVNNYLMLGAPTPPYPSQPPAQIVFNIDVFLNQVGFATASASENTERSSSGRLLASVLGPVSPRSPYIVFTSGLAYATGGRATTIADSDPAPVVGDVNGDFCVDNTDYSIVMSNYGKLVPPGNPAADFNNDRIVDYYDYATVVQNWGSGCK